MKKFIDMERRFISLFFVMLIIPIFSLILPEAKAETTTENINVLKLNWEPFNVTFRAERDIEIYLNNLESIKFWFINKSVFLSNISSYANDNITWSNTLTPIDSTGPIISNNRVLRYYTEGLPADKASRYSVPLATGDYVFVFYNDFSLGLINIAVGFVMIERTEFEIDLVNILPYMIPILIIAILTPIIYIGYKHHQKT